MYFVVLTIFACEMGVEYSVLSHETCFFFKNFTNFEFYAS